MPNKLAFTSILQQQPEQKVRRVDLVKTERTGLEPRKKDRSVRSFREFLESRLLPTAAAANLLVNLLPVYADRVDILSQLLLIVA